MNQESYRFISGDVDYPYARVIEVTFYSDSKNIKYVDMTGVKNEYR